MRFSLTIAFLLLLTGVNLWMNWRLWKPPVVPATRPAAIERKAAVRPIGQQKIFRPQRDETHAAPPWAYLESEDYSEFAANLRDAEIPEATIRNILLADMARNLDEQSLALDEAAPDTFWANADDQFRATRERERKEQEIRKSMFDLAIEIFGYPVDLESIKSVRREGRGANILGLALGFIDYEKVGRLIGLIGYHNHVHRMIDHAAEGIFLPEDKRQLRALRDNLENELTNLLRPHDQEELKLRLFGVLHFNEMAHAQHGFEVSGPRFRQVAAVVAQKHDLIARLITSDRNGFTFQPKDDEAVEVELARLLGPELYADWARGRDERFRTVHSAFRDLELPKSESVKVFNSLDRAEAQAAEVRADDSLAADEVVLLLTAIRTRATRELFRAVGNRLPEAQRVQLADDLFADLTQLPEIPAAGQPDKTTETEATK